MSRLTRLFSGKQKQAQEIEYVEYASCKLIEPQDILIAGFPKSGNTWVQLLVASIQYDINPETTPDTLVQELIPDLHLKRFYKRFIKSMAFKTHDLPQPSFQRVISIIRDGRDVLCSYKHYNDALGIEHSFDEMIESGAGLYPCPWHEYVDAWEANPFNAERLVVCYEDLKQNCVPELRRIADFLGASPSDERLEYLAEGTGVAKMQRREAKLGWNHPAWPSDKPFVRKGVSGTHRSELSTEQIARFEEQAGSTLTRFGYQTGLSRCA